MPLPDNRRRNVAILSGVEAVWGAVEGMQKVGWIQGGRMRICKIEVEHCGCCPEMGIGRKFNTFICRTMQKGITRFVRDEKNVFPEWCPLEEVECSNKLLPNG